MASESAVGISTPAAEKASFMLWRSPVATALRAALACSTLVVPLAMPSPSAWAASMPMGCICVGIWPTVLATLSVMYCSAASTLTVPSLMPAERELAISTPVVCIVDGRVDRVSFTVSDRPLAAIDARLVAACALAAAVW